LVARAIPGTLAIPHAYGRLQYGEDLELTFRTLVETGVKPNVAAAVIVGVEPNWTDRIVEGIAKTGKSDEVLARADVVSLHVLLLPATHHLINTERLS
jgi:(2R)-sulfolactate sulfo-lyase subunit beta